MDKQTKKNCLAKKPISMMSLGIGIGAAIGTALGVAMKNVGAGLAIGCGMGAGIGVVLSRNNQENCSKK